MNAPELRYKFCIWYIEDKVKITLKVFFIFCIQLRERRNLKKKRKKFNNEDAKPTLKLIQ